MVNDFLSKYLHGERIPKPLFDELKLIVENFKESQSERNLVTVLNWFRWLQGNEILGWRTKEINLKIAYLLFKSLKGEKILLYALFCPSYKKGAGAYGFKTDGVGNTTKTGLVNLKNIAKETEKMGFSLDKPLAIFFDIAVEQPQKSIPAIGDLEKNIANFKEVVPKEIIFKRLSVLFPELLDVVGLGGVEIDPLPISQDIFERIVERGKKFYELFAWSNEQILERSRVIASSEAIVGSYLKKTFPNGILVYTPTMLERAAVYSGKEFRTDPLPVIFPKRDE